jgi:hypothetical protein
MNAKRRKAIDAINTAVSVLRERLESLRDEERDVLGALPESLQQSERGQMAAMAADELDEAVDALETAIDAMANATSA